MTPRLSYCINCKKETATVIVPFKTMKGVLLHGVGLAEKNRVCMECGKPKVKAEVEQ